MALDRRGEGFGIRRLDGAQLGEKASLVLPRGDPVKPLCGSLALGDVLVRAAHQLQQRRLVLARDGRRLHRQQRCPERGCEPDRVKQPGHENHHLR